MNVEIVITDRPRLRNGFATVAVRLPELGACEVLDLDFDDLHAAFGESELLALDLVLIAGVVYVLDKSVPRRFTDDFWTRQFEVTFPVSDPARWARSREELQGCLAFLTGDEWTVDFIARPDRLFAPPRRRKAERVEGAVAVSLFSGGLDSLVGVIDHLAERDGRLALIGHHDATGTSGDQRRLHGLLEQIPPYAGRSIRRSLRVRPLPSSLAQPGQPVASVGREHTLRSRSLVFLALGLYAARALGSDVPLLVPENGLIAINIPLTPSRVGSCSTRTTHPFFLRSFGRVVAAIGLSSTIENPLQWKAKGEAIAECRDRATLDELTPETVSCAHPSRRATWLRRHARNCGYCVPCLIRRASLHHVGRDDGQHYGVDVCAGEMDLDAGVGADVRAVLDCLDQVRSADDVAARVSMTGALPAEHRAAYIATVGRGLGELRAFVGDRGSAGMRQRAGLR